MKFGYLMAVEEELVVLVNIVLSDMIQIHEVRKYHWHRIIYVACNG